MSTWKLLLLLLLGIFAESTKASQCLLQREFLDNIPQPGEHEFAYIVVTYGENYRNINAPRIQAQRRYIESLRREIELLQEDSNSEPHAQYIAQLYREINAEFQVLEDLLSFEKAYELPVETTVKGPATTILQVIEQYEMRGRSLEDNSRYIVFLSKHNLSRLGPCNVYVMD